MNALAVLKAARDKIADEINWTQYAAARDSAGMPVKATDPKACRWCMIGALIAIEGDADTKKEAASHLREGFAPGLANSLSWLNDRANHKAVLELFDITIKRLTP
jgi:hypothetical protein